MTEEERLEKAIQWMNTAEGKEALVKALQKTSENTARLTESQQANWDDLHQPFTIEVNTDKEEPEMNLQWEIAELKKRIMEAEREIINLKGQIYLAQSNPGYPQYPPPNIPNPFYPQYWCSQR